MIFWCNELPVCFPRVVRKSSYRLNSLILVAVFVGFVGTLLHVIKLDDDMAEPLTTTICNVSFIPVILVLYTGWGVCRIEVSKAK